MLGTCNDTVSEQFIENLIDSLPCTSKNKIIKEPKPLQYYRKQAFSFILLYYTFTDIRLFDSLLHFCAWLLGKIMCHFI